MNESKYYRELYKSKFPKNDKLDEIKRAIKWDLFRPVLNGLFKDAEVGRPNADVVVMAKMLVLQAWYSLSDKQLEIQCKDRLTFQNFLGYPSSIPDARTVRLFRDRLAQSGMEKEFWDLFKSQLEKLDLKVEGVKLKDVEFIRAEEVKASKDSARLQDLTMLEVDSGSPAGEGIIRINEMKTKADNDVKGTSTSISYEKLKKSKERGNEAKTKRSADGTW